MGLGLTRNNTPDHWGQTGLGKKRQSFYSFVTNPKKDSCNPLWVYGTRVSPVQEFLPKSAQRSISSVEEVERHGRR